MFAGYAEQYSAEGDTRAGAQGKNRKTVRRAFVVDDVMLADFKEFLAGRQMTIDEAAFAKDRNFIRAMIRYEIDVALFSGAAARQRLIAEDPQAQYALSQFPEAEKLLELSKSRTTASKLGQ